MRETIICSVDLGCVYAVVRPARIQGLLERGEGVAQPFSLAVLKETIRFFVKLWQI